MNLRKGLLLLCFSVVPFSLSLAKPQDISKNPLVSGVLRAYGEGCSKEGVSRPLAKMQAEAVARAVAQQRLIETLKGVKLVAGMTAKDMVFEESILAKKVEGFLKGATKCEDVKPEFIYDREARQGCIENYCMEVQLFYNPQSGEGFVLPILKKLKEKAPKPTPKMEELAKEGEQKAIEERKSTDYDGVIIDATDIYYEPQVAPYIAYKDAAGQLQIIFTPSMINLGAVSSKGAVAAYATSDARVKDILRKWNIKNPLVVKAIGVDQTTGALIISRDDAALLSAANAKTKLLEKGNVIIKLSSS